MSDFMLPKPCESRYQKMLEENERVRQASLDVMMHFEDMKDTKEKLQADLDRALARADACQQEAQTWKQEARTQSAIVAEIYQELTGKTGEPGDWNGARPLKPTIFRKQADAVEAAKKNYNANSRIPDGTLSRDYAIGYAGAEGALQDSLDLYAQRLRNQAGEIEKAGGES